MLLCSSIWTLDPIMQISGASDFFRFCDLAVTLIDLILCRVPERFTNMSQSSHPRLDNFWRNYYYLSGVWSLVAFRSSRLGWMTTLSDWKLRVYDGQACNLIWVKQVQGYLRAGLCLMEMLESTSLPCSGLVYMLTCSCSQVNDVQSDQKSYRNLGVWSSHVMSSERKDDASYRISPQMFR